MDGIVNQVLTEAVDLIEKEEGRVTFFHFKDTAHKTMGPMSYGVAIEFGKEAEDSDMAGGAAYGTGETLEEAFKDVAHDMRWELNGA